jgi:hypothetical protein
VAGADQVGDGRSILAVGRTPCVGTAPKGYAGAMTPSLEGSVPRVVADTARQVIAKVRPGNTHGRRSLPIRRDAEEIRARWEEPPLRAAILREIPVANASLAIGEPDRDWGRTVTIDLELSAPVPGMAAQTLAGKAVRRLKALCETGEIPNTDFNPSARADAGEPVS